MSRIESIEKRLLLATSSYGSFTLIDADNDRDITPLPTNTVIDLPLLGTRNLNIRADFTGPIPIGSVVFNLNGKIVGTDNAWPYSMAGDKAGDYLPWNPTVRSDSLEATVYSKADGKGYRVTSIQTFFAVMNSGGAWAPHINAGKDQIVTLSKSGSATTTLRGSISHLYGLPAPYVTSGILDTKTLPSKPLFGDYNATTGCVFAVDVPASKNTPGTMYNVRVSLQGVPNVPADDVRLLLMDGLKVAPGLNGEEPVCEPPRREPDGRVTYEWKGVYVPGEPILTPLTIRLISKDSTPIKISALVVENQDFTKFWGFDFGTFNSPLNGGFKRVDENTLYSKSRGYGWEYQRDETCWTQVSGPDEVSFLTPSKPQTLTRFTVPGRYVLQLMNTNGDLQGVDTVAVTVNSPTNNQQIKSFTLMNADNNRSIGELRDGSLVDYATLPTHNLGIRADASAPSPGSVLFELDGKQFAVDNQYPFALAGNSKDDFLSWNPAIGIHHLTATPFSMANGKVVAGTPLSIYFDVAHSGGKSGRGLWGVLIPTDQDAYKVSVNPAGSVQSSSPMALNIGRTTDLPIEARTWTDFFGRWTGQIQPTKSGQYSFRIQTNPGESVRLWVANQCVINTFEGAIPAPINLESGKKYDIRVEYLHKQGDTQTPQLKLMWTPPGQSEQLVPTKQLYGAADERMAWWRQARFGMFIHLGLYSVLSGVYDDQPTPGSGAEWARYDLNIPEADYHNLVGEFNPLTFDARQYVSMAKRAGMEYIVVTTKHHEGFSLYDSATTTFDVNGTMFARDILKELADEAHRQGIKIGWYYSIMDWDDEDYRGWQSIATTANPVNVTGGILDVAGYNFYEGYDPDNPDSDRRLIADAVRVRNLDSPSQSWITIDDGDDGYSENGTFYDKEQPFYHPDTGYEGDFRSAWTSESPLASAHWRFTELAAGHYEVQATWPPDPQGTPQATYFFYNGIGDRIHGETIVDQSKSPSGAGACTFNEYIDRVKTQLVELVKNYTDVDMMWFDGDWGRSGAEMRVDELLAAVRKIRPNIIINDRIELPNDIDDSSEQKLPETNWGWDWETCMTMNDTWGYKESDQDWKSGTEVIRKMATLASKGGNLLLNVGPTAQGLPPIQSVKILDQVGKWMETYGESIKGTTSGPSLAPTSMIATRRADRVYVHVFNWPSNGIVTIPKMPLPNLSRAYLLSDPTHDLTVDSQSDPYQFKVAAGTRHDAADTVIAFELKTAAAPNSVPDRLEAREPYVLRSNQSIAGLSVHNPSLFGGMGTQTDTFAFTTLARGSLSDKVEIRFIINWGDVDLWLYNSTGSAIASGVRKGGAETISLNGLPAGTYSVRVTGQINPNYDFQIIAPFTKTTVTGAPLAAEPLVGRSADVLGLKALGNDLFSADVLDLHSSSQVV